VPWNTGCTDCDLYYEMFIAIFVTLAIVTAPLLPLIVRFLKIRDPSGVMLELKLSAVFVTLLLVGWSLLAGNVDGLETGSIGTWEYISDATKSTVQVRIAQQDIDVRMFDQAIKEVSDMYKYTVWKDFLQRRNHDPRIGLAVVDVPF